MPARISICIIAVLPILVSASGCAVPQPRGQGKYQFVQEPVTKAWYHLYLPLDYVRNDGRHPVDAARRWPLVMTFHGMRPYDAAKPQEREWEAEADYYGYIVCAPELRTCDSWMEYPLTKEHHYVLSDKTNVIAIMDHVFATTRADRSAVLSTSWSCGGYLAHYFANRFPDRFTCIATRLSNFSPILMLEDTVPLYRDTPVAIFIGDGDFNACKTESEMAVAWYMARGFRTVRGKMIDNMGHRRIPQTAAAFFAEQLNLTPLHPVEASRTVAQVQMTDYHPPATLLAQVAPPGGVLASDFGDARSDSGYAPDNSERSPYSATSSNEYNSANAGRNYPYDRRASRSALEPSTSVPASGAGATRVASGRPASNWLEPPDPVLSTPSKVPVPPSSSTASRAGARGNESRLDRNQSRYAPGAAGPRDYATDRLASSPRPMEEPRWDASVPGSSTTAAKSTSNARRVNIQFGGPAVGTAPHYLAYAVDLPKHVVEGADFLWMDNGVWMGDEPRGVKILDTPGLHRISVLVITRNNEEYRGAATVQILERGPASAGAQLTDQ